MKKTLPLELVYQVAALVVSIILVHLVYQTVIRPNAEVALEERAQISAEQGALSAGSRSHYIVIKDY